MSLKLTKTVIHLSFDLTSFENKQAEPNTKLTEIFQ